MSTVTNQAVERGVKPLEANTVANTVRAGAHLLWPDLVKAVALLWIFANHMVENLFGYPYIANPWYGWPPFSERLAQLAPLGGHGVLDLPLNALRYIGWFGDQGVQLFLIVSGFGLTWGLLGRNAGEILPLGRFYLRRAERIYPTWWAAHLFFVATWLLVGWGVALTDRAAYLSFLGIRITSGAFYYFAPAWWYIGLLIQLYLVFPLLWYALRRWGPIWLLAGSLVIGFGSRIAGIYLLTDQLDAWLRGAVFLTRLPEFVFGICLAMWLATDYSHTDGLLRRWSTVLLAILVYMVGLALALTLPGNAAAPFLLGVSAFVVLYALFSPVRTAKSKVLQVGDWIGRHSYSLYLMHQPFVLALVPLGLLAGVARTLAGVGAAIVLTVASALLVERMADWGVDTAKRWSARYGILGASVRCAAIVLALWLLLIGAELTVQRLDPQEVFGWGERPALMADPQLGWKLIPDTTTHLRWESYDYVTTANGLGFPGPAFPEEKPPGTTRIMTVGDAFTSAEGVDTAQAWPRLLEQNLAAASPGQPVQVMNFAMTGYGPNQYAAVVDRYAPQFKPDVILVELYVNDFFDALISNEQFQSSIGFGRPDPNGLLATLSLANLRRFVELRVKEPLIELIRRQPQEYGYFLGQFAALERDRPELSGDGRAQLADRLAAIKAVADQGGSRVMILMVPSPIQVCEPDQLAYYPRYVDLNNKDAYDLDQPQRNAAQIASSLEIPFLDLRSVLAAAGQCVYQPRNMHWTEAGHQVVADYLADLVRSAVSVNLK